MRTFRELAGWALLLVVQLTPFVALGLLAFFAGEGAGWALLVALLLALAWPRLLLSARRLREPPEDEVAEADGRRPVLLLHAPARATVPLLERAFFGQPGLFRDFRDAFRERAIERAVASVGPLLRLARPAPPPAHGPLRRGADEAWRRSLERLLRRSALAVIVIDGSDANVHEIERATALLGWSRTVLFVPPELPAEAYGRLRARLPLLPALDRRARAIRFAPGGRPVRLPRIVIDPSETVPAPEPPAATWLLVPFAIFAGLVSAIATPLLLADRGYDRELFVVGSAFAIVLGIALAGLSRRAVRLLPANEAVMVTVAALPWIFFELLGWARIRHGATPYRLREALESGAVGAAYAVPLLSAAAVVLAVGSLVRRAPGRRKAFAVLGAAAVLPFVPLALSIGAGELALGSLAGAFVLGLSVWAASGEPARANAPFPIGAAVAGALSVGALSAFASHGAWASLLSLATADPEALRARIETVSTLASAWPWFAVAGPAVAVLSALPFSRRVTRVGLSSTLAFAPFVLACTLASVPEARARARLDAFGGADVLAAAQGVPLAPGFELPLVRAASLEPALGPADVVLDASGVIAGRERVATLDDLALAGTHGSPPAVTRALARLAAERGAPPRVAVRRDMDASHVARIVRAARRAELESVDLVVRAPRAPLRSVRVDADGLEGSFHVVLEPSRVVLTDPHGWLRHVPHAGGAIDEATLRAHVLERRQSRPYEEVATLVVRTYPGTEELVRAAALLREHYPRVVLGEQGPP